MAGKSVPVLLQTLLTPAALITASQLCLRMAVLIALESVAEPVSIAEAREVAEVASLEGVRT